MDNTKPIVPMFNGQLEHGAAALCDFFLIAANAGAPVTRVTIMADGKNHEFLIEPHRYKMALFLGYCAVLKQQMSFLFDTELRAMLEPYFSKTTVADARLPATNHSMLQPLVLGTDVRVSIVLKPGYELPKHPGRTVRKLIEYGWKRHESGSLYGDSPVPLIRQAIVTFRNAVGNGTIRPFPHQDREIWPSLTWQDRVWDLYNKLGMRQSV